MSAANYQQYDQIAVIGLNHPPLNSLGHELRIAIDALLQKGQDDPSIKAIIVMSQLDVFCAGADIREFGLPAAAMEPNLRTLIEHFEVSKKPVIAAIQGICAGGGLELAMAAHYRVAQSNTEFAFPEVKLGLLPGAGGTQKLPRAIGVESAIKLMINGNFVKGSELANTNLIDCIVDGDFLAKSIEFAKSVINECKPLKRLRDMQLAHIDFSIELAHFLKPYYKNAAHYPAPIAIIDSVKDAITESYEIGLQHERERFIELSNTSTSRALRHAFFAPRACQKIPGISATTPKKKINSVGIIGAGTMGTGIAINFLNANIKTIILDQLPTALDASLEKINKYYQDSVKKLRFTTSQIENSLGHLKTSSRYEDLRDVDLVIEAAYEDLELKKSIFKILDQVTSKDTILATNTSTLDINEIAACVSQPEQVVGLHFFSPANIMKLLEVVRANSTSDTVIATAFSLAKQIGKLPVLSGVCDGFIGNRMLEHYGRMARILVEEGALPWQVDKALEEWGMGMGPFRVFDLVGNDVAWAVRKRRYIEKPHIRYGKVADEICLLGRFGQKTNKGWYHYESGSRDPVPDPEVEKIIIAYRKEHGISPRDFTAEDIIKRCIFALINEGARILEEGIALRASDIDVVYLTGYGFPRFRGGPMKYADELGLGNVIDELNTLYQESGDPFWRPAKILEEYAAAGKNLN